MNAAAFTLFLAIESATIPATPEAGEEYELTIVTETTDTGSNGSSGTSHDQDAMLERVIAVRPDGLELEYDLTRDATAQDRAREWKFPARVFKPLNGPMQLLNRPQLETRLDAWLKAAKWDREICGKWIFTWNAFRIDCDPSSVISIIKSYDLRSIEARDGASIEIPGILGVGLLKRDGQTFRAVRELDPEAVRRERAESDVAIGQIMQEPVTLEAALAKHAKEKISGTVSVMVEADSARTVRRRTIVTELQVRLPNGEAESRTSKETVERRRISKP